MAAKLSVDCRCIAPLASGDINSHFMQFLTIFTIVEIFDELVPIVRNGPLIGAWGLSTLTTAVCTREC